MHYLNAELPHYRSAPCRCTISISVLMQWCSLATSLGNQSTSYEISHAVSAQITKQSLTEVF